MSVKASLEHAEDLADFVNISPTPFHAVQSAIRRLEEAGFKALKERDSWRSTIKQGGKFYLTRDASTIIAFAVGVAWKPGNAIGMIGTHTDSPGLRVKPISRRLADGFLQVGVETYASGLWHSWFDRDLGIAGRVMVKTGDRVDARLVKVDRPILRIPSLATHLDQGDDFAFNQEVHLLPIAGLTSAEAGRRGSPKPKVQETNTGFAPLKPPSQRHHSHIIELLAAEARCKPEEILDLDLLLFDTQPACIGGLNNEFIYSARLDNLAMTHCAIEGLLNSLSDPSALDTDPTIRLIACFDHEEIGSVSAPGAASQILPALLRRLSSLPSPTHNNNNIIGETGHASASVTETSTAYEQTLARSFLISADMEHAAHPNHPHLSEPAHRPRINAGTVVKVDASHRYATGSPGIALLQECARRARGEGFAAPAAEGRDGGCESGGGNGVPLQFSVPRNDCACGGTIGPLLSAGLGCRAVDVGNCLLAMHSVREVAGCDDVGFGVRLFESFFENFGELGAKVLMD